MLPKLILIFCCACFASFTYAEEELDPHKRLTLLTENFGSVNYSLSGREFEHRADQIGGTSTAFLKKLLIRANIPYAMKLRKWSVSYDRALTRPNYGVFSTARTDTREDLFEWVGPIAHSNWVLFVKKGSTLTINNLDDIRDLRVGGYRNSSVTEYLLSQGIKVSALPADTVNPTRLAQDLIDVWAASDITAWEIAEKSGYPDIEVAFVIRTIDLYLALNKETKPEWINQLKAAYNAMVAEGDLKIHK